MTTARSGPVIGDLNQSAADSRVASPSPAPVAPRPAAEEKSEKPAGTIPPCLTAADRALETGSVDKLAEHLAQEVAANVHAHFRTAHEKKQHAQESVDAGRAFVEAYVGYIHFVEGIHNVVSQGKTHAPGEHPEHLAQAELPESER